MSPELTPDQRREFPALAMMFDQLAAQGFLVDPIGFNPTIYARDIAREIVTAVTRADANFRHVIDEIAALPPRTIFVQHVPEEEKP